MTGPGLRAHTAPDEEGFGRLLDQHADAVGQPALRPGSRPIRGTASGPCRTSCRRPARRARRRRRADRARYRCRLAEVELITRSNCCPASSGVAARAQHGVSDRGRGGSAPPDAAAFSTVRLAITSRAGRASSNGPSDALRRTARTHQQHAASLDRETQIDLDVAHQPDAVGVVAVDRGPVELQGVDGLRVLRARRCARRPARTLRA